MVGKIKAALDARCSTETLIIARTDSIATEGFASAIERAEHYREAGADILFIEAPQTQDQMYAISKQFSDRIPLLANMVEGGKTPHKTASELEALGFSLVIFPGGMVRVMAYTAQAYLASLSEHGSTLPFRGQMLDFDHLNELLNTNDMLALGAGYDSKAFEETND
jgi:2-methylisocitrate lyase-like PEP mutase family enzyme